MNGWKKGVGEGEGKEKHTLSYILQIEISLNKDPYLVTQVIQKCGIDLGNDSGHHNLGQMINIQ